MWIHYVVGVSQFAECRENRPVNVWEMLIKLLKSPIPQWWGKWKSDSESVSHRTTAALAEVITNNNYRAKTISVALARQSTKNSGTPMVGSVFWWIRRFECVVALLSNVIICWTLADVFVALSYARLECDLAKCGVSICLFVRLSVTRCRDWLKTSATRLYCCCRCCH